MTIARPKQKSVFIADFRMNRCGRWARPLSGHLTQFPGLMLWNRGRGTPKNLPNHQRITLGIHINVGPLEVAVGPVAEEEGGDAAVGHEDVGALVLHVTEADLRRVARAVGV